MSENSNPHPSHTVLLLMDGNKWSAKFGDHINLQESNTGWGNTPLEAVIDLCQSTKKEFDHLDHATTPIDSNLIPDSRFIDFLKLVQRFLSTPIFDDYFPAIAHEFDSTLERLLKEMS